MADTTGNGFGNSSRVYSFEQNILLHLRTEASLRELVDLTGRKVDDVAEVISKYLDSGHVRRVSHDTYVLTGKGYSHASDMKPEVETHGEESSG